MEVKLVTVTPDAEKLLVYMARVSSSKQDNPETGKLINYLIKHSHFSPFEMVHMVVEISCSRSIAQQLLRHRSFSFQEFSQRYSKSLQAPETVQGRQQAKDNRQSSVDPLPMDAQVAWSLLQKHTYEACQQAYESALKLGVAREQARDLLPLATPTRIYMAGSLRSWIHYLQVRCQPDTQEEHRDIAEEIKKVFIDQFPETSHALSLS